MPAAELRDAVDAARHASTASSRSRASRIAGWIAIAVGVIVVVVVIGLRFAGDSWFVVETPSMGQAAPVGTLIVTTPIGSTPLHVGDVITFHPPTTPAAVYTHRIAALTRDGRITTRGDINGAVDGWRLIRSDVIGRASVLIPGVGWLIRALPLLFGGIAVVWLLSSAIRRADRRLGVRLTGFSLVIAITVAWLRPLVSMAMLQITTSSGPSRAQLVSTGLLPIRVTAANATSADLVDGQVGTLTGATHVADGHYAFAASLHLPWWGWGIVAVVCALPLLWTLIIGVPAEGNTAE